MFLYVPFNFPDHERRRLYMMVIGLKYLSENNCQLPQNTKTRETLILRLHGFQKNKNWSERHDLNVRPLPPQGSALAKLSYAPMICCLNGCNKNYIICSDKSQGIKVCILWSLLPSTAVMCPWSLLTVNMSIASPFLYT